MYLTIHRGTQEICGSCVELQTKEARILIDFGLPLSEDHPQEEIEKKSREQLIKEKFLPNIQGLYENPDFDGILISHPHPDHYGLLPLVDKNIPLYMGKGTKTMIETTYFFNYPNLKLKNVRIKPVWNKFWIKDIAVTPYLVDHSGFDSFAFLIESEGKRIFYTGDFRGHGRKKILFETMIKGQIKDIDYLIMEGTMLSREDEQYKTEEDVQKETEIVLKKSGNLTLLQCSSQNIDRLVSACKACRNTKTLFVLDPYTAYTLEKLRDFSENIPQHDWKGIKVFCIPHPYSDKIFKDVEMCKKFGKSKIEKEDVFELKQKMLIKDSKRMREILKNLLSGTTLIYSQWDGYLKKQEDFWDKNNVKIEQIHASGHAYVEDLVKLTNAIKPKHIIAIHTEKAEKYKELFKFDVIPLKDGDKYEL